MAGKSPGNEVVSGGACESRQLKKKKQKNNYLVTRPVLRWDLYQPNHGERHFSSYPGNCAWVTFSLLICDQLLKSAVVLNTLISHSTCGRENLGSERSLLDLHYSFRVLPLLLVLMLVVDLLRSPVSVRVCIRVTHKSIEKCWSLSLPKTSSLNIQMDISGFVSAMI